MSKLSVITCTVNENLYDRFAHGFARHFAEVPIELIKITNPPSLAAGYNMGLHIAKGSSVIFCHDDIEILSPGFAARLIRHLEEWDIVGVAGAERLKSGLWLAAGHSHIHGQVVQHDGSGKHTLDVFDPDCTVESTVQAKVLDGLFIAAKTAVAKSIGFDEATFRAFHFYDLDFTLRSSLAGYRVGIARDLLLYHGSPGKLDEVWYYYCGRFEQKYDQHLYTGPTEDAKIFKRLLSKQDDPVATLMDIRRISKW
jgi:GT2 family glycosyltransferase